jgi:hypothetical protein
MKICSACWIINCFVCFANALLGVSFLVDTGRYSAGKLHWSAQIDTQTADVSDKYTPRPPKHWARDITYARTFSPS